MTRADFYAALRRSGSGVFGTSLSQRQVDGIEALLAATDGLPITHRAYLLATAYLETDHTMQPVRETLAGTDDEAIRRLERAWAKGRLEGVRRPYWRRDADGKTWLGRGYVQLTHRDNYVRAGRELGVDVVADPGLAMQPTIAAQILVRGCQEGWFTGKRLSDYLPGDYLGARRIVNGTDRAADIARYAEAFEAALQLLPDPVEPVPVAPTPVDASPPADPVVKDPLTPAPGGWGALWKILAALFHRKGN